MVEKGASKGDEAAAQRVRVQIRGVYLKESRTRARKKQEDQTQT